MRWNGLPSHRVVFQLGQQGFAVALGVAQHGVEQAFGPGLFQLVGAANGFANGRVGRHPRVQQLVQAHQQQRFNVGIGGLKGFLQ